MSHRSTPPSPRVSVRGVFNSDPLNPPPAPAGAEAIEIRDADGQTIAFVWVAPGYAGERFHRDAWDWLETHTAPTTSPLHIIR